MATATVAREHKDLEYGYNKEARERLSLERELRLTEVCRAFENAHPYVREIECLRVQVPLSLLLIEDGDWFAGRIDRPLVGVDPERGGLTEAAWFCRVQQLEEYRARPECTPEQAVQIQRLLDYWVPRQTSVACRKAFSEQTQRVLPSDDYYGCSEISYPMYGLGGPVPDYDKLLRLGIPGLREQVKAREARASESERVFFVSLNAALDILAEAALGYAAQAEERARTAGTAELRERYGRIARSSRAIAARAPVSYHEAIQLLWLYALVALPRNYGRLDVALGDFLAADLDSGALTPAQAREMTVGLWRLIVARGDNFNNRVVVGGRGRRNEANADRFALLAMEAQLEVAEIVPQLTLRWYDGMDRALWDKAMELIGAGLTFPILYNDDRNVPAVAKALAIPLAEAEQYVPYGCGEYVVQGKSVNSPDAALNVAKALDVTLHNGIDSFDGAARGAALGGLAAYATFDELLKAFERQLAREIGALAEAQARIYDVTGEQAAFPLLSLLFDDCVERGRPLLAGGVRHRTGCLESFGNNTAADSLYAIKRVVYDDKLMTPGHLLECLRADFQGFELERRLLQGVPKYGNDHEAADAMSLWVNRTLGEICIREGRRVGLDAFMMVLVNNGDSVLFGKTTGATADGRRRGEPLSNGNQPGAGADQTGLTALLKSMSKLDPSLHAGATHNVKMSRGMFHEKRSQTNALLRGYFALGGTQAMVTVTDRRELERALECPEEYSNLIVRVGGYTERFVRLPRAIQIEVIRRTLY